MKKIIYSSVVVGYFIFACLCVLHTWKERSDAEKRALMHLEEIKLKINTKEDIQIIISGPITGCWAYRDSSGRATIFIGAQTVVNIPDLALRGAIAHEVGHIVLGHLDYWGELTLEEKRQKQIEADIFAISIVGKYAVSSAWASFDISPRVHNIPVVILKSP